MYESGIIDSSFGGGLDCADGCAMLLCSGDSEEPERVREAVLSRAEALLREGIGADYFLRMKRSALGRRACRPGSLRCWPVPCGWTRRAGCRRCPN